MHTQRSPSPTGRPGPAGGLVLAGWLLACAGPVQAAGGHHAVDDAAILEPGQCQIESWREQAAGGGRSLLHVGPACRVGAVEWGLNLDRTRIAGQAEEIGVGAQLKWAGALGRGWQAGLILATAWQDSAPGRPAASLVLPLTWQAGETLQIHLSAGRDFRRHAAGARRAGAALEWAPLPAWSFVAERFEEGGAHHWRAGARWAWTEALDVDASRTQPLADGARASWTIALTWAWAR